MKNDNKILTLDELDEEDKDQEQWEDTTMVQLTIKEYRRLKKQDKEIKTTWVNTDGDGGVTYSPSIIDDGSITIC